MLIIFQLFSIALILAVSAKVPVSPGAIDKGEHAKNRFKPKFTSSQIFWILNVSFKLTKSGFSKPRSI